MKTKAKNDQMPMSQARFTAIWSLGYLTLWVFLWLPLWAFVEYGGTQPFTFPIVNVVLGSLIMAFLAAWVRRKMGTQFAKRLIIGWLVAIISSGVISRLAFGLTAANDSLLYFSVSLLALLMSTVFVQATWWFWRWLRQGCLWVIAALLIIPLFAMPFENYKALLSLDRENEPLLIVILGLVQSLVQLMVLRRVWAQDGNTSPLKRKGDAAAEQAALDRLSVPEQPDSAVHAMRGEGEQPMTQGQPQQGR